MSRFWDVVCWLCDAADCVLGQLVDPAFWLGAAVWLWLFSVVSTLIYVLWDIGRGWVW